MSELIHLISGPRNISTALMYSFDSRGDTTVLDEPMYAVYLDQHDVDHPGKEDILNSQSRDIDRVIQDVFLKNYETDYVFIKNMAHHFIDVDPRFIYDFRNLFLIRDPKQLICSFSQVIQNPTMQDIGLEHEYILYLDVLAKSKYKPIVLDSNDILSDPEGMLKALCKQLNISYTTKMLEWEAGPIDADGIWAKYWYKNVHQSTGFKKQQAKERELPAHLEKLYEKAKYYYDKLSEAAIKP